MMAKSIAARAARATLLASIAVGAAACAPEAVQNYAATGFNGYLQKLPTACPNLQIGQTEIALALKYGGGLSDNYNYWLDMTSRLYYNQISPEGYRAAVTAQLGPSNRNDAAFDCIVNTLPAQR